jgi:hypothetical protein
LLYCYKSTNTDVLKHRELQQLHALAVRAHTCRNSVLLALLLQKYEY